MKARASAAARATGTLVVGRTLAFAATFVLPLVLVRVLDPAAFGTYKQIFLIFATASMLAPVGMGESLFYFLPRAAEGASRYVANAVLWLAGGGLLVAGVLLVWGGDIASVLANPALAGHLPALAVVVAFMM